MSDGRSKLSVVDMFGRLLIDEDIAIEKGNNSKLIDLSNVTTGIYFVTIQSDGAEKHTLRLVVE